MSPSRSSTRLVLAGDAPLGTAARPDDAAGEHDVGFDGRIAAAVEDLAGVDVGMMVDMTVGSG